MPTGPAPECLRCAHFNDDPKATKMTCAAFPEGIPEDVYMNRTLHRTPLPGDRGLQFTPRALPVVKPARPRRPAR